LTPADPEGKEDIDPTTVQPGAKYFQLTHDYLVPALRDWLTRKQKETRRGRAELLLADRAALWNRKPESRYLPAWGEWANIRLLTRKKDWDSGQRAMMARAGRYHLVRGVTLACLFGLLTFSGLAISDRIAAQQRAEYAADLVQQLPDVQLDKLPEHIDR